MGAATVIKLRKWLAENARDLARIAKAAETIARELAEIRRMMQETDQKEENR